MVNSIKPLISFFAFLFLFILGIWSALAIRFSGLFDETASLIASWVFALLVSLAFIISANRKRTSYGVFFLFLTIIAAWSLKEPSHNRDWAVSVSRLPSVTIKGDQARIRNIRNFDYRTEKKFSARYYDKNFDLKKLATVDYGLSYWDGNEAVAHTILSFGFTDGQYLAISVETRLEQDEPQSGLRGLFKEYELIYILGDERDLLRLRTNFRKEEVFLYPTNVSKENVRKLFIVIMDRVNDIASKPEFYNTLTQSCLSSLVSDFKKVIKPRSFFDIRRLQNGYSDSMLYENGWIDSKSSFEETKKLHHINQYVAEDVDGENYSIKIRPHLDMKSTT